MNEDYILTLIKTWENDLLNEYGKMPKQTSKSSISQKIINKLVAYSKMSDYRPLHPDEHTKVSLN
ncbi:MAG: hypothetical protein LBO06_02735 [Bacteroidales bacterium]|jgi:hypothetical protein|nr:hypothetical protein [Bacteroidales bacterium]